MVNTYLLVNPHIEGNLKTKIKAKNSIEAANIFYKNLSEHFNNFSISLFEECVFFLSPILESM